MSSPLATFVLKSANSVWMLPDTCDPTCTVTTAFGLPVAETVTSISPCVNLQRISEGYRRKVLPSFGPSPRQRWPMDPERAAYQPVISRPCVADCQMSVSQY